MVFDKETQEEINQMNREFELEDLIEKRIKQIKNNGKRIIKITKSKK